MISKRKAFFVLAIGATIALFLSINTAAHAQVIGVTLPSVPTGVTAVISNAPEQVTVSWAASAETSGIIEGYYVYRNGSQIGTTAGTSIVDGDLSPGIYNYVVVAYDANGVMSSQSSPVSVTLVSDTTPPTTPSGVTITGTTSTNSGYTPVALTISWSPSSDSIGVAGYYVYRNGVSITSSTAAETGTSITDMVTPGTYTYSVVAYDSAQNFSARSTPVTVTVSLDSIPPSVPRDVSVQQISASNANVSWASSTDPVGVAGYQIFRNGVHVATAAGSPYADSGLSAGVTYSYQVAAYDVAGNVSSLSSPAVNIAMQTFNGPGAPYGLTARFVGTSSAALSWAAAIDPLAITGYTVYRNDSQIATVSSTNYLDQGLATGTLYAYNVTASDISGAVSPMSASSSIVTPLVVTASVSVMPVTAPPTTSVVPAVIIPVMPSSNGNSVATIIQSLYYGLRGAQVSALQSILVQQGYLPSIDATGFFGTLTRSALEKFQCAQNIACTGGAGWGLVGPKTRAALNALDLGGAVSSSGVAPSTATTASLAAELQALEAELAGLEKQTE